MGLLRGSETCPSGREAGLRAAALEGKNPEAFEFPWGNDYRKSRHLQGHFGKDTIIFLRLSTSGASCDAGPQATLLSKIKALTPKSPHNSSLGDFRRD